jgi:hypothetical protein
MNAMSSHAVKRAAQRNLSSGDITYVIRHGRRLHRAGACFYFLAGKDIPKSDRRVDSIARLEGTTVMLDNDLDMIVTVYRNRVDGLKAIKKKRAYLSWAA